MKLFIGIFLYALFYSQLAMAEKIIYFMFVGEQRQIQKLYPPVGLANPNFLKLNKQTLVAIKSGVSTLKDQKNEILIYVLPTSFKPLATELEEVFKENKKLVAIYKDKKVTVFGEVLSLNQWKRLSLLQGMFERNLNLKLSGPNDLLHQVALSINQELEAKAFYAAKAEIRNNKIIIYSNEKDQKFFKKINQLAAHWGVDVESSELLEIKPMIEIEITIAEVKKNTFKSFGLDLPTQYSAKVAPFSFDEITLRFNTLLKNQEAKIIASPKLLCRSGETAKFIAGGEIPIKLISSKIMDVQWKKYGVILNITPQTDNARNISTKLTTEVSLLDEAHVVDGIPGILTNRVETHFDLNQEKTIALSGLIKNELGRGESGPPILSEIPVLGELFKSQDYKQNKTELLILVTPKVVTTKNALESKISDFWKTSDEEE
ncbi:MAG: type II and III secretion system protein [Oligoflexia bacterium]|nr:type II and III secretion system protein [Oligoflexia bacterium]